MGAQSKIEWCDDTFNPWWGCQRVSPACEHCYAETFAKRLGFDIWGPPEHTERRFFGEAHWAEPLKWNAAAERAGERRRVFCASMADVFEAGAQTGQHRLGPLRQRLWSLVDRTPWLDWLLLTKRPENILGMVPGSWLLPGHWPANVWAGTTVETQQYADERIPHLLRVPAAVRFLSCEPLLSQINLGDRLMGPCPEHDAPGMGCGRTDRGWCSSRSPVIQWVIAGGESGPHSRPSHPEWFRSLRDQCQAAGVAFHFKQWGEWWPSGPRIVENARMIAFGGEIMYRLGKHRAGRELDGRTWDEFPAPRAAVTP